MKIKWLGQAAFVIESKEVLVTDPCNPIFGKLPKNLTASVVTVSHAHGDHSYTKGVGGSPKIINQIGNFTAGGFEIKGIATFHDNRRGKKRGDNIVYIVHSEDLTLCHLGDLGHVLTDRRLNPLSSWRSWSCLNRGTIKRNRYSRYFDDSGRRICYRRLGGSGSSC